MKVDNALDKMQEVLDTYKPGNIYVATEDEVDDGIPFEEKMEKLKYKLKDQFERSAVLQVTILSNLQDL